MSVERGVSPLGYILAVRRVEALGSHLTVERTPTQIVIRYGPLVPLTRIASEFSKVVDTAECPVARLASDSGGFVQAVTGDGATP